MLTNLSFANPSGAWAFLAVAAVVVLYLYYRRYRPQRVTGLFLWGSPRRDASGGRRRERLLANRAFRFDLAAAALLALALTQPGWTSQERTAVVILDNSLAMRSRNNHLAAMAVAGDIASASRQAAVVLAGTEAGIARALAPAAGGGFAAWLEENYSPSERAGDLAKAVAFAKNVYGEAADFHILTNQSGAERFAATGATVHAFAGRGGNLAFAYLWRRRGGPEETLFLAVENYGEATDASLSVVAAREGGEEEILSRPLRLAEGRTHLKIAIPEHARDILRITLSAEESGDSIAFDSRAVIPPPPPGRPTVALAEDLPAALRGALEAAFRASGCALTSSAETAGLLVTADETAVGGTATLRFIKEDDPAVARPPYRVETESALCRDLDLSDAVWTVASRSRAARPEEVYIVVGDTPLYWREENNAFLLNLRPDRGNFTNSAAWPILMDNLGAFVATLQTLQAPSPEETSAAERAFLPLYGKTSDTRTLSPRAATHSGAGRESGAEVRADGRADLRWPLFLLAALFIGWNWHTGRRRAA